ncbi:MAG: hypothetical protein IT290_04685 [Deltaproteobacteria bacterium]|nr:hypothetical protein [Deltaproteobacteria bacterium]
MATREARLQYPEIKPELQFAEQFATGASALAAPSLTQLRETVQMLKEIDPALEKRWDVAKVTIVNSRSPSGQPIRGLRLPPSSGKGPSLLVIGTPSSERDPAEAWVTAGLAELVVRVPSVGGDTPLPKEFRSGGVVTPQARAEAAKSVIVHELSHADRGTLEYGATKAQTEYLQRRLPATFGKIASVEDYSLRRILESHPSPAFYTAAVLERFGGNAKASEPYLPGGQKFVALSAEILENRRVDAQSGNPADVASYQSWVRQHAILSQPYRGGLEQYVQEGAQSYFERRYLNDIAAKTKVSPSDPSVEASRAAGLANEIPRHVSEFMAARGAVGRR